MLYTKHNCQNTLTQLEGLGLGHLNIKVGFKSLNGPD